ncbi:Panacea domain-containing protein [Hyphococcus luteus]|uniref:Panacea domain-containing protein n=1 Tax=Hyphococcus luteus TaxID=2058213 RepID=UPI0013FE3D19|nr:Panacea domain-containing protein [Marinicaulis flavus]
MADAQREPAAGFDNEKAAQIAAYFCQKAGAEGLEKLKLIKLIYLAERLYLERYGMLMNLDEFYSLPHGPIASSALNGINGEIDHPAWKQIAVSEDDDRTVKLAGEIDPDHLSKADVAVLEEVWNKFKHLTASEIRNYTHKNCPEYTELEQGRLPITVKDMLTAVGAADAQSLSDEIESFRKAIARLPQHAH